MTRLRMNSVGAALVALSMGIGSLAVAQPRGEPRGPVVAQSQPNGASRWDGPRDRPGDGRWDGRGDRGPDRRWDNRRGDRDDRRWEGRRNDRDHDRWERRGPPPRVVEHHHYRGAGPRHDIYRGGRLPSYYRAPHYVVNDWRGHHLNAPPRGYHWVQTGGDYVLAAIATGIILQVLLNN